MLWQVQVQKVGPRVLGSCGSVAKEFAPVGEMDIVTLFGRKQGVSASDVVASPFIQQSAGGPDGCEGANCGWVCGVSGVGEYRL